MAILTPRAEPELGIVDEYVRNRQAEHRDTEEHQRRSSGQVQVAVAGEITFQDLPACLMNI